MAVTAWHNCNVEHTFVFLCLFYLVDNAIIHFINLSWHRLVLDVLQRTRLKAT